MDGDNQLEKELALFYKGKEAYQPFIPSDLQDIPFSRAGESRFKMIKENLSVSEGTLLDIGANLGYFCHKFEEAGFEDLMNMGFIIKNLLGLILDTKKSRFHEQLPTALVDIHEAVGGIDLAVIDGTNVYLGLKKERITVSPGVLIVGTDAFAVEAVGMHMVGFDPLENPILQEARNRGLGEIDLDQINIIGDIDTPRQVVLDAFSSLYI